MYLKKLIKLAPPPDSPVGIGDFSIIYEKLDIRLPNDYFKFLSVYGTGMFGNSLEIFSPFAENRYLNLFAQIETLRDSYTSMKRIWNSLNMNSVSPPGSGYPFDFYPADGGLIP